MIDVITSGYHVGKMVSYHYGAGKKSSLIATNKIFSQTDSDITKKDITNTIYQRNLRNDVVRNPNIHISLNFHKDDTEKIDSNPFFLTAIADEYMEKMGYGDQPYAVFRHDDKEHPHIHIVSTRINDKGKKIKDSFEKRKSGRITEQLEQKHGLTIAKEHGKHYVKYEEKDLPDLIKNHIEKGEKPLTKILENCLDYAMKKLPTSEEDYRQKLNQYGVVLTERIIKIRKGDKEEEKEYFYHLEGNNANELSGRQIGEKAKKRQELQGIFAKNKAHKEKWLESVNKRLDKVLERMKKEPTEQKQNKKVLERLLIKTGIKLEVKRRQSGAARGKINGYIFTNLLNGERARYTATELKLNKAQKAFLDGLQDNLLEKDLNGETLDSDQKFLDEVAPNIPVAKKGEVKQALFQAKKQDRQRQAVQKEVRKLLWVANYRIESKKTSLQSFVEALGDKGIQVRIKRRETGDARGKINGFIFSKDGVDYTASSLGFKLKEILENLVDDIREPYLKEEWRLADIRDYLEQKKEPITEQNVAQTTHKAIETVLQEKPLNEQDYEEILEKNGIHLLASNPKEYYYCHKELQEKTIEYPLKNKRVLMGIFEKNQKEFIERNVKKLLKHFQCFKGRGLVEKTSIEDLKNKLGWEGIRLDIRENDYGRKQMFFSTKNGKEIKLDYKNPLYKEIRKLDQEQDPDPEKRKLLDIEYFNDYLAKSSNQKAIVKDIILHLVKTPDFFDKKGEKKDLSKLMNDLDRYNIKTTFWRNYKSNLREITNIRFEYANTEGKNDIFTLKDLGLWDGEKTTPRFTEFDKYIVDDTTPNINNYHETELLNNLVNLLSSSSQGNNYEPDDNRLMSRKKKKKGSGDIEREYKMKM